ncbi:relaxase/mobilization nuclease domain-containing protein [Roseibium sp.]|uniref:relaxase/mobilization nuclease domain-containing protein n=1 Tax=Roseibium sp. TaxID=1936156 RepID=UPI003A9755B8
MIIEGFRVPVGRKIRELQDHLFRGEENDEIHVLQGSEAQLDVAIRDAKAFDRTYSHRHFVVAPFEAVTREQAATIFNRLADEFSFDLSQATIVEHQKKRAEQVASDRHWHVMVPEVDPMTGDVMCSKHSYARHEKVARISEFELGHRLVIGAHHDAVVKALVREHRFDVASALIEAQGVKDGARPGGGYSHKAHQIAKRNGISLPLLSCSLKAWWEAEGTNDALVALLENFGVALRPGEKPNEPVIYAKNGEFIAALRRLLRVRKGELSKRMEEWNVTATSTKDLRTGPAGAGDRENARADPKAESTSGDGTGPGRSSAADSCRDTGADARSYPGGNRASSGKRGPGARSSGGEGALGQTGAGRAASNLLDLLLAPYFARLSAGVSKGYDLQADPALRARKGLSDAIEANAEIVRTTFAAPPKPTSLRKAEREEMSIRFEIGQNQDEIHRLDRKLQGHRDQEFSAWERLQGKQREHEAKVAELRERQSRLSTEMARLERRQASQAFRLDKEKRSYRQSCQAGGDQWRAKVEQARKDLATAERAMGLLTQRPSLAWGGWKAAMAYARDLEERGLIERGPEDGDYVPTTDIWGVGQLRR